jgi:membrane protease YdiL (CAAX protease family)
MTTYFVLVFILTWGMWVPAALATEGMLPFQFPVTLAGLLGAWAPGLVAIALTAISEKRNGLRALFARLGNWRIGLQWYLFGIFWPVLLSLGTTGLAPLLGQAPPDFQNPPIVTLNPLPPELAQVGFLALLPTMLISQLFGSSLGEELGWRGFALPRMQSRQGPLWASIVLGLMWGLWHLPRIWVPGEPFDFAGAGWLILGLVLNAILYTWLFDNTRGSLIPVILLHTSQALTNLFLAQADSPLIESLLLAALDALVVLFAMPFRSRARG